MSYQIRRSRDRKYFDHGWLKTYHTFSFASYYDPNFVGFRDLRVINEDRVAAGHGFPLHDHQDMEIISVVLEGELAHKDSMGNQSILKANEIQAMSAGTGVTHSEYNPSAKDLVHFLQIWIVPDTKGITPSYQQKLLPASSSIQWVLIASKQGLEGSLKIQQDVELYSLSLNEGKKEEKQLKPGRYAWLQIIEGDINFNGNELHSGDGVAIGTDSHIILEAISPSRMLFFDLK